MASLKDIKLKIQSYKKTGTVTHAMEAVSAVKMRKTQERALGGRAYAAAALSALERLAAASDITQHTLAREVQGDACFIVITSDKGLAGSLNSGVIKRLEQEIKKRGLQKSNIKIAPVGRRARDYFKSRGYTMLAVLPENFSNVGDDVSESEVMHITTTIVAERLKGAIGDAFVVYQNFLSTFEQEPSVRQILPLSSEMLKEFVAGIRPAKGKYAPQEGEDTDGPSTYTIEPEADEVLGVLLPKLLNIAVFHALLEGKASEHSARMVAMKNATDKAKEKAQDLTRTFNKVRQAAITREVSEITSGMEAMK